MAYEYQSEESKALNQREHSRDASAKRVQLRALETSSGDFVNINAEDNGDGTYSLKTSATFSGTVNGTAAYSDSSGTDKKGLVDADRHVQVDVVSLPAGGTSGTQYDDGDAVATPTGTVSLGFDGANVQALNVDSSGNLQTEVTNTVTVDGSGVTQPVSAASLPLPTGAATATKQDTIIGHVDGIETQLSTIATNQLPDGHNVTIDNASIPVTDNGGSLTVDGTVTANLSATDNAVLDTIETNTDFGAVTGGGTEAGALRVTVANNSTGVLSVDDNGGSLTVDGSVSVSNFPATQTVNGTITANLSATDNAVLDDIALNQTDGTQKTQLVDGLGNVIGATSNALDVNIASGSSSGTEYTEGDTDATFTGPVVLVEGGSNTATPLVQPTTPSDTQPISASSLPLPTGAATAANQQTDALTDAELRASPVVVDLGANNDVTVSGTVSATQSGTWNINNVSGTVSLPTGAATAANQSTANSSLSTIATNTGVRGSSSAVTSVAGSATSVQLLAANSSRKEATITNDSTADLYLKLGTTASTTSYTVKLRQDESYITDKYTGRIDGIWGSATGNARITQVT